MESRSAFAEAVVLTGVTISLVPLSRDHVKDLSDAVADGQIHRLWYTTIPDPSAMEGEIDRRLALMESGSMLPFAVLDPNGRAVGMTTFMNVDAANRRVEIGSTWYARSHQRTSTNTETKLLMLAHAFETLECIAVEFRTHVMNSQSRAAIERLGAKLDGVLRSHMIMPNGTVRDTACYSILASEWPAVRANLTWRLRAGPAGLGV